MSKKIFKSIFFVAMAVFFACIALITGVLYSYYGTIQRRQLQSELALSAKGVELNGVEYLNSLDIPNNRLTWIDSSGNVIFDSRSDPADMENHSDREEFIGAVQNGEAVCTRYSKTLMEQTIYAAKKLSGGSVLRISVSRYTVIAHLISMIQPLIIIVFMAFVPAFVISDNLSKKTAERERREFTANVSHELKTPLQSIMGSAELLENGLVRPEDTKQFVGRIREEAQRLVTLIDDIIRLSRLDEKAGLIFENVELYSVAAQEIENLEPAAAEKDVTLKLEGKPMFVRGDKTLLREIIYNLVDNAIKYNVVGGSVTVKVDRNAENTVLSVSDTGIGIDREHQERVFERFYRVDKSHSRKIGGTGLGLSIVKHGAADMGGSVELKSEPGKGSVFTVYLPG